MKRKYQIFIFAIVSCLYWPANLYAQDEPIKLNNPSFEGTPSIARTPDGWYDCGFTGQTPPDIMPNLIFQVARAAQDGNTFLGLVVRANNTWEKVAQRLKKPLQKDKCYVMSIGMCKSDVYISSNGTIEINYSGAAKLRIWAGNGYCNQMQLLAESPVISHNDWKDYTFKLEPKQNFSFIMLEAYYNQGDTPYNGNLLLDKISNISFLGDCKPPAPKADLVEAPKPKPTPPPPSTGITKEIAKNIKTGQPVRINQLTFAADSTNINPQAFGVLDELYQFLADNNKLMVEIGGHTNSIPEDDYCDRISEARAKVVADYLVTKGIEPARVKHKGYGKRKPVASDSTQEGRKKNQRVEIRILNG